MNTGTNLARAMFVAGSNPAPVPPVALMDFPTLKSNNPHLQLTTTVNTSYVMVANDDVTKCIVIDSFEATWQDPTAPTQPKGLFGTVAEEDATTDLFIWMCSHVSGSFIMTSRIKLAPGKDLIHYNIKGPGQGGTTQPCFLKLSYHLVDA